MRIDAKICVIDQVVTVGEDQLAVFFQHIDFIGDGKRNRAPLSCGYFFLLRMITFTGYPLQLPDIHVDRKHDPLNDVKGINNRNSNRKVLVDKSQVWIIYLTTGIFLVPFFRGNHCAR